MHSSALHDPYANATPSQRLAAIAHNMRRAKIASRAILSEPPRVLTFSIPNTPFGTPKIRPWKPREPAPVYRMWFEDLIALADRMTISRPLKMVDIQRATAEHFGFSWKVMFCTARTAPIVRARQTAMYLAKTMTPHSLPEIGRRFGGRDHTTVLHAVRKMDALFNRDAAYAAELDKIRTSIAVRLA